MSCGRWRWFWVACAVGILSGCHSAIENPPGMIASLEQGGEKSSMREPELPMSQAAQACIVTAQQLEGAGHDVEAARLYERARGYNPRSTICGRRLAVLYERQGKYADAMTEYQRALEAQPKDADLLNDFGYFYLQRDNLPEAEKYLRQAVGFQPAHKQAWGNLGIALGAEGRFQEAFEAFSKAATPAEAHSNVGMILAQQKKFPEARQAFQQALALNAELEQPRHALEWLERGPSVASAAPPVEESRQ